VGRQYTGAIAPAFGENVVTHSCDSCGIGGAPGDGSDSFMGILIGIIAGAALALLGKGGSK
jgi:hypothetical protein